MKSFTDLEQSKKLAEILPLESADMYYYKDNVHATSVYHPNIIIPSFGVRNMPNYGEGDVPCWSIASLLDAYPMVVGRDMDMYCCWQNSKNLHSRHYNNPIDACYEMINKLHEQKIL